MPEGYTGSNAALSAPIAQAWRYSVSRGASNMRAYSSRNSGYDTTVHSSQVLS